MASGPKDISSAQYVTTSADIRGLEVSSHPTVRIADLKWMVIIMENNLYKIERTGLDNPPTVDTIGMLMTEYGTSFVKLHPVKLTAKPKNATQGRWTWKRLHDDDYETLVCSNCFSADGANEMYNYCPNCGAKMKNGVK